MSHRALFALPLIAIAAIPPIVADLETRSDTAFREQLITRSIARNEAAALAARLDERVNGVRNALVLVRDSQAVAAIVQEGADCGAALAELRARVPEITELALLDRSGRVRCASDPTLVGRNMQSDAASRAVMRGAVESNASSSGLRGRTGGLAILVTLRDASGNGVGALVAQTPIEALSGPLEQRAGRIAFVLDAVGEVVSRASEASPAGERAADQALAEMRTFMHGRNATEIESLGTDGLRRVYGVLPAGGTAHGLAIVVGVPVLGSLAAQPTLGGMVPLLTATVALVIAIVLAWMFGGAPAGASARTVGNITPRPLPDDGLAAGETTAAIDAADASDPINAPVSAARGAEPPLRPRNWNAT